MFLTNCLSTDLTIPRIVFTYRPRDVPPANGKIQIFNVCEISKILIIRLFFDLKLFSALTFSLTVFCICFVAFCNVHIFAICSSSFQLIIFLLDFVISCSDHQNWGAILFSSVLAFFCFLGKIGYKN